LQALINHVRPAIKKDKESMKFGERVRTLREARLLTQNVLAERMGVSVSYISKVENERLHFGDYPSEKFIHRLATELEADEDELLLLADKVPESMRQRMRERPDAFRAFAKLDDRTMDELLTRSRSKKRKP
jgi:transcriptional regulator with XRE-family HTH domain